MDIDHWWSYLEEKVVEAVVFKAAEMVPVMATSIAPWIAPCARGLVTYNTEYLKGSRPSVTTSTHPMGCPKTLSDLIRKGVYDPLHLPSLSLHDVRKIAEEVGIHCTASSTRVCIYNGVLNFL